MPEVPCCKRKTIENVGPLLKVGEYQVTKDMEKTEVLSAHLQWRGTRSGNIEPNWTHTRPLDLMGCTHTLMELANVMMGPLLIVSERSDRTFLRAR